MPMLPKLTHPGGHVFYIGFNREGLKQYSQSRDFKYVPSASANHQCYFTKFVQIMALGRKRSCPEDHMFYIGFFSSPKTLAYGELL